MFLKKQNHNKDGKDHVYWSLVENNRTGHTTKHRLLCYLGELNSSQEKRWRKTINVFNDEGEEEQLHLFPSDNVPEEGSENIVKIDLKTVGLGREPDIEWSKVAAILAINRLCDPGSELSIEEQWFRSTALDDLLNVEEKKINSDRLYDCLDQIIRHKEELEKHLKEQYGELFNVKYEIILYDITSTYFEGENKRNDQAKRGYSRDHRPDCKQICIALVVSEEGFPFSYEIFDGNRVDVTTLEEFMEGIEKKYGKAQRIWVFDRGIVSEENLEILRKKESKYLTGTRRSELKKYEKELLDKDWKEVQKGVEVKLISAGTGKETYVLCRAIKRKAKEEAMRKTASEKLEKYLEKLSERIKRGKLKDAIKIERKIGAITGKYASISDLYEIEYKEGKLEWKINQEKIEWCKAREGAYLLRTNLTEEDPEILWKKYIQLTEAEAAFRVLKSELAIRPIWHQKTERVHAHIMVAFMGYALWVTLKHILKNAGVAYSPGRALNTLKRIHSGDIIMQTVDKVERYRLRLRRVFRPDAEERLLLNALKIQIPEKLSIDLKLKCGTDL